MAAGMFTKQADYLTAKYLNDVNDSVAGGQIQSVPSAVPATQGIQTQPGDRIIVDDATALALSDTTIGTLYGGIYMYVQSTYATTAPALGQIAFLRAADLGATTFTSPITTAYVADGDAQPTTGNPAYVLGIYINALTKSNYGWIQVAGVATVLFDSTITATTAGSMVTAKASSVVPSCADNGVTITQATWCAQIGVSIGAAAASTASKVAMLRWLGRL
jgi:hypothetical protein